MKKLISLILVFTLSVSTVISFADATQNNLTVESNKSDKFEKILLSGDSGVPNPAKERSNSKDTLSVSIYALRMSFLPIFYPTNREGQVGSLIFDPLYTNDKEGRLNVPRLAESYKMSNQNKTITFNLRKDVKWSDGKSFTAKDVENTFLLLGDSSYDGNYTYVVDKLMGYESFKNGKVKGFSGIKVIDGYTIAFNFKEALVNNFDSVASFPIMPAHVYPYEKGKVWRLERLQDKMVLVGCGRYFFDRYDPEGSLELKANPNWYGGQVKTPKLSIKSHSGVDVFDGLEEGTIDIAPQISSKGYDYRKIEKIKFVTINQYLGNSYGYFGFNLRDKRLAELSVRQALTYGFNRQAFIDLYYDGNATVCNAPVSQLSWANTEDINKYEFDPERARKLLDKAGWVLGADGIREKKGRKLSFVWDTYTDSAYVETLIPMLRADWQKIGVFVEPNLMEFNELVGKIYSERDFEIYNMAWSLSTDPSSRDIFHSANDMPDGNNSVGLRNAQVDKLLVDIDKEFDINKRKVLMHQYLKKINELQPYMFIAQASSWDLTNVRVKNFEVTSFCDWTYKIEQVEIAQ